MVAAAVGRGLGVGGGRREEGRGGREERGRLSVRCADVMRSESRAQELQLCRHKRSGRQGSPSDSNIIISTMTHTRSSKKQSTAATSASVQAQSKAPVSKSKKIGKGKKDAEAAAAAALNATTPVTAASANKAITTKCKSPKPKVAKAESPICLRQADTNDKKLSGSTRKSPRFCRQNGSSPVNVFVAIHNQQPAASCGKKDKAAEEATIPSSKQARSGEPARATAVRAASGKLAGANVIKKKATKKVGYHGSKQILT